MKTHYTHAIRTLMAVLMISLLASSCSKKSDPDPLDQYVGSWTETMLNGQPDTGDDFTISKSGSTLVLTGIKSNGDIKASVSSSGFQADDKNIDLGVSYTHPDNSKSRLYMQNLAGSLSGGKLTLTFTLFSQSSTMWYKQDFVEVFVKK